MSVVDGIADAARYAAREEARCPGLFVLLMATDIGIHVSARMGGRSVDRLVPWVNVVEQHFNAVKNGIDSAIEGLSCVRKA